MSYTDLELGKEVKLVNGSSTESKFLWEVSRVDSKEVIHIQTKTMFGNFFKVVDINDIEII